MENFAKIESDIDFSPGLSFSNSGGLNFECGVTFTGWDWFFR